MNWKTILALAIPSIASFAAATVTGTINLIMVGKLGALAIAIVGVTNIIMYNIWALFSGIGHTINYLVAQNYGSSTMKIGVERAYVGLYLSIAAGVMIFLTGIFFSDDLLALMGVSPEFIRQGSGYLTLRFFAVIFSIFVFVFHGFFRGIGDTKTPMVTSIIGNVLMIFFTYTLTYGQLGFPKYGLIGAGFAVLLGEAVVALLSAIVFFVLLHKKYETRRKVRFKRSETKLILSESSKLGAEEFSKSIAMFVYTVFVARLGTEALAANEIALSVMSFGFMPAFAFGSTATILVGQYIGRGEPIVARQMGTETAVIGSIFIFLLGIVEFIFAKPIISMYTDEAEVIQLAVTLIKISAFLQLFDAMFNFYAGGLRGIGDTTFLLKISVLLGWFFFIPLAYLLIFTFSFNSIGAWLSLYTFTMVLGTGVMIRYYRTDWLSIKMKSTDEKETSVYEV